MLYIIPPNNSVRQAPSSAFKSLSFKGKRGYSKPYTFKDMSPITECINNCEEFKKLMEKKPLPRARIYGAIICCRTANRTSYIMVQGRYTGKWSFPKGHLNKYELPYNCALRELEEETGIRIRREPVKSGRVGYGMYYLFEVSEELPLHPRDSNEIMNTRWVTLEEMNDLSLNSDASAFKRLMDANEEIMNE